MRKVLLVTSHNTTGLQYYRQLMPHAHLDKNFDISVSRAICDTDQFNQVPDEKLKEFDCIQFIRQISLKGDTTKYVDRCHRLGLKVYFDIDDYWRLPDTHPMSSIYIKLGYPKQVEEALICSDVVTVTTENLAHHVRKYNTNVHVLPNCIDPDLPQAKKINTPNRRVRFGWIGGVYHLQDIRSKRADFFKFFRDKELVYNAQLCLGGYTLGQDEYKKIEEVMTDNYSLDKDYKEYLLANFIYGTHYMNDKPYKRLYSLDVNNYLRLYNEVDVSLIPLVKNTFNSCKSELKLIEAGMMGKAVICDDVEPYTNHLTEFNKSGTFYERIVELTYNQELRWKEAKMLSDYIRDNFNINTINKKRWELYQ